MPLCVQTTPSSKIPALHALYSDHLLDTPTAAFHSHSTLNAFINLTLHPGSVQLNALCHRMNLTHSQPGVVFDAVSLEHPQ